MTKVKIIVLLPLDVVEFYDLAVEVTVKKHFLAGVDNLDHHGDGFTADSPAACDLAMDYDISSLPKSYTTLATNRLDGDSLTAAAIIDTRLNGQVVNKGIVDAISLLDRKGPASVNDDSDEFKKAHRINLLAFDRNTKSVEKLELVKKILTGESLKKQM